MLTYALLMTGTIGHVAHGKSTLVKAISGVQVSSSIACLCLLGSVVMQYCRIVKDVFYERVLFTCRFIAN
jgi:hydroxyethylthiazole kinase-like sugar kinase family protein